MSLFRLVLLTVILSSLVFALSTVQIGYGSPYTDISVDTAYSMITCGCYPNLVVLDVRNQSEYDGGHLNNSVLMPVTELEARIAELEAYKDSEIIVYCQVGIRSFTAAGILDSYNFSKVYNMVGGLSAWESAGYPVVPEFSSLVMLLVFAVTTFVVVVVLKRKRFAKIG